YKIITGGAIFGSAAMARYVRSLLQSSFGDGPQWEMNAASRVVYTILANAAHHPRVTMGHFFEYKIPLFWEFRKVHQSAEALTPFTNYRSHSVDKTLELFLALFFVGTLGGTFQYLYPGGVTQVTIINVSVMFFVYNLIANLRHSHIWLS